jgi:hypothetical protein
MAWELFSQVFCWSTSPAWALCELGYWKWWLLFCIANSFKFLDICTFDNRVKLLIKIPRAVDLSWIPSRKQHLTWFDNLQLRVFPTSRTRSLSICRICGRICIVHMDGEPWNLLVLLRRISCFFCISFSSTLELMESVPSWHMQCD